jgi:regulator of sirC expression with transglutaminase-like and TPR domain
MICAMQQNNPARTRFRALIRRPDPQISLAEAALCVAWEDQGTECRVGALQQLDAIAEAARPRLVGRSRPPDLVAALNDYLFGELGFHGNTVRYNDPANSFLDQVLATRTGLPITLAIVYMEVGWRLGLPIAGVALPGHFLARYAGPGVEIVVDPFNRGRIWSRAECEMQIASVYSHPTPALIAQIMAPPSRRAILARLLRNLKNLYAEREDVPRTLAAVERIVLLEPEAAQEVRDRGLLRARLGQLHGALEDLDRYARMAPQAPDLARVRQQARALAVRAAAGN